MNITLVISSLSCGGAERVMSMMANYWADQGAEVSFITMDTAASDFYALDRRVQRVALGLARDSSSPLEAARNNLARVKQLRRAVRTARADVIISFQSSMNVLVLLATWGLSVPVIVSERVDPRHHPIGVVWDRLRRCLYPAAAAVVVQSSAVHAWMERHVPRGKVAVVPNPVLPHAPLQAEGGLSLPSPFLMGMGRLVPQKGFDLLVQAFALAARDRPEWSVVIVGEGPEKGNIADVARRHGVYDRVHLIGRTDQPGAILNAASIFVLSSRYEGFPNALCEAMSAGLPVISFDCPSGPSDIIRDGEDGVLVPENSIEDLAAAIRRLMEDTAERRRLGQQALRITRQLSLPSVMGRWNDIIGGVIQSKTPAPMSSGRR